MFPSTGRVSSTNASGSKPMSNTKNNRIQRTSSKSKKNKLEAQPRKTKSSLNKNNHVSDYNANVKNVALSKNSANVCLSCNECLFFANMMLVLEGIICDDDFPLGSFGLAETLSINIIRILAKQGLIKGLSKLKYTKDHLFLACQMGKSKKESHPHRPEPSTNEKLQMLHMDLCGPMRAKAVATACYTQNRSLIYTRYNKTPYELLRDRKPELKYLYSFGALCYPTNDFEDLGKLQPKADIGIFIGPELHGLTSGHISSGLVLNQAASTSAKPPIKND
ncbi:retrovirus-related pol polyprotein from transposon TNT 1-94 [Tanacetum coccineum]